MGLFAPPFRVGYYAARDTTRIDPDAVMRPIVGYLLALAIGLEIVIAVSRPSIGLLWAGCQAALPRLGSAT